MKISLLFGICTILVFSYLLCVAAVAGLQIHCMYSYVDYDYLFMVDRHTIYVLQSMNSIHRLKILVVQILQSFIRYRRWRRKHSETLQFIDNLL